MQLALAITLMLLTGLITPQTSEAARADEDCTLQRSQLRQTRRDFEDIFGPLRERTTASHSERYDVAARYGETERRVPADLNNLAHRTTGYFRIHTGGVAARLRNLHCTATMISACHILTASHCFYKVDEDGDLRAFANRDIPQRFVTPSGASAEVTHKLAGGNYKEDGTRDWAVARLNRPIGERPDVGWMDMVNIGARDLTRGANRNARYTLPTVDPTFDPKMELQVSVDHEAEVVRNEGNIVLLRGNGSPGSSGANLSRLGPGDRPEIVALFTSAASLRGHEDEPVLPANETRRLAGAISTNVFFDDVQKFMRDHPCSESSDPPTSEATTAASAASARQPLASRQPSPTTPRQRPPSPSQRRSR